MSKRFKRRGFAEMGSNASATVEEQRFKSVCRNSIPPEKVARYMSAPD